MFVRSGLCGAMTALASLLVSPPSAAHPHNSVDIIKPPTPSFPEGTVAPGRCDVRFEITDYSKIAVTSAECSDYVFCKAARVAVEDASLRVIDNNGEEGPGIAKNVLYPIEFTFGTPSQGQINWIRSQPLFACDQAMMF